MLEERAIKVPKLIGSSNYELQAIRIKAALIAKDLYRFLSRNPENIKTAKENKEDSKALSYIQLACIDGPLLYISAIDNLLDAWKHLERLYAPRGFSSEFILFKEFFGATLSSLGTVENYLATIQRILTSLKAKDLKLPNKLIIAWTLHNLGPEFDAFIASTTQTYRAESNEIDMDNLFADLMDESRRIHNINEKALIAKNSKNSKPRNKNADKSESALKCDHYGRKGHKKDSCWKLHPELAPSRVDSPVSPKKPKESNISDVLYSNSINPSIITTSESALSVKHLSESQILDSGATSHICCNINLFNSIAPTSCKIAQGNALTLSAQGIRAITIQLPNLAKAVLEEVLYILEL